MCSSLRIRGDVRPMLKVIAVAAVSALAVCAQAGGASADDGGWVHATGLIDKPKYPPDFKHFDYVNPDAPKGGLVRMSDSGTFDTLNPSRRRASTPLGLGLIYDSLMTDRWTKRSTEYGLLADALRFPADYSSVTYHIRAEGSLAGRPADHRRRRRLVVPGLHRQGARQPEPGLLLQARRQGREDRRPGSHLHLRRNRQPRAAADRRPAQRPAEALVGRHRRQRATSAISSRARSSRRSARARTR